MADASGAGAGAGAGGGDATGAADRRPVGGRRAGAGRPRLPDEARRTCRIQIPLSAEAHSRLVVQAERAGKRPGAYLAQVVVDRLARLELLPLPEIGLPELQAAAHLLNDEVRALNQQEACGAIVDVDARGARQLWAVLDQFREALCRAPEGR